MSTIIVCDGKCGRQSPDYSWGGGPHVANSWYRVEWQRGSRSTKTDLIFCEQCWQRIEAAMKTPVRA